MKKSIRMSAPAKLNLYLDVLNRRGDGYHNIESVMQAVELYDYVTVTVDTDVISDSVEITCSDPAVPLGRDNLCYKAVKEFFGYCGDDPHPVEIDIEKHIPMGAGLAGGSTDAAAAAAALNSLMGTYLDSEELCNITAKVGADVSFCLLGRTQYCTELGDTMRQLPQLPDCMFVIAKGSTSKVSTPEAYSRIDSTEPYGEEDIAARFCRDSIEEIAPECRNIFEKVIVLPEGEEIKRIMLDSGALCACMTGSGSAFFGIFTDNNAAAMCAGNLRGSGFYAECAAPARRGSSIA